MRMKFKHYDEAVADIHKCVGAESLADISSEELAHLSRKKKAFEDFASAPDRPEPTGINKMAEEGIWKARYMALKIQAAADIAKERREKEILRDELVDTLPWKSEPLSRGSIDLSHEIEAYDILRNEAGVNMEDMDKLNIYLGSFDRASMPLPSKDIPRTLGRKGYNTMLLNTLKMENEKLMQENMVISKKMENLEAVAQKFMQDSKPQKQDPRPQS